ncbi:hypothetical protein [Mesorhizobium sp. DCY119]|uniref:hypothetical protein n=1 Tax=Mesorhizobium sp. DCY119 TaxID=2108445 RepID=UPI000E6B5371|nr:hypothetical protein [Mesorhizobium sp. DCY119]RJG46553.1 hypothetical protein D3Y55_21400 [Mesorhizobium sp. DCY119]
MSDISRYKIEGYDWAATPSHGGVWVRHCDYEALRQQLETARAEGRDEGLEEARAANRKLHRRAQIAEGMKDSLYGIVDAWARVIRGSKRKAPEKICWASYKLGQMSGVELVYYDLDKRCKRALKSGERGS